MKNFKLTKIRRKIGKLKGPATQIKRSTKLNKKKAKNVKTVHSQEDVEELCFELL